VHADTKVHPDLLNFRFGYVAISRASHEATLFTDDAAKLARQLGPMSPKLPLWKSVSGAANWARPVKNADHRDAEEHPFSA
jgi:hypothetical protein